MFQPLNVHCIGVYVSLVPKMQSFSRLGLTRARFFLKLNNNEFILKYEVINEYVPGYQFFQYCQKRNKLRSEREKIDNWQYFCFLIRTGYE